jgi:hypothetical protein
MTLMTRKYLILALAVLLVVQAGVAAALMISGPDYGAIQPETPIVAFDRQAVDRLVITGENGASVTLAKRNGAWVLPDAADAPVAEDKVAKLLDRIAGLKKGWPVATSTDEAKRFAVADDDYKHRIAFYQGETRDAVLYVGTSPSFRSAHVRAEGDDETFNVGLVVYDIGDEPSDWVDKSLLKLNKDDIAMITFPDATVTRGDEGFAVDGLADGAAVDTDKLEGIVDRLADLTYDTVLGAKDAVEASDGAPFALTVKKAEGEPTVYTFVKEKDGDDFVLTTSASPFAFRVQKWQVDKLREATRDGLMKTPETADKKDAG